MGLPFVPVTSDTLLGRLRVARPDDPDWRRFEAIYSPLIRRWVSQVPGCNGEVDDVTQEVMLILIREIPRFQRQREGSFRTWLRQITAFRIRNSWRKRRHLAAAGRQIDQTTAFLDQMADSSTDLAQQLDGEHDDHVLSSLLATVRPDFSPETWAAFQKFAVEGRPAAEVASELNTTVNAVIKAKSRILSRLRREASGFVD
jgi:RNA polymerase sigma-70 factor (ECF subfamily)